MHTFDDPFSIRVNRVRLTVQRVYKCYSAINISFLLVLRNACMMPFFSPASPTAQLIGIIVAKETVTNLSGSTRAASVLFLMNIIVLMTNF